MDFQLVRARNGSCYILYTAPGIIGDAAVNIWVALQLKVLYRDRSVIHS